MGINKKYGHRNLSFVILIFSFINCLAQDSCWVQVRIPVACIRDGKEHSSEMTSQAIMGTPLLVLDDDDEWIRIKSPDGYEGYMNVSSIVRKSHNDIISWRTSKRLVSMSLPEIKVYSSSGHHGNRDVVTELTLSSIIECIESTDSVSKIRLPDGREGYVETKSFIPIEKWASRETDTEEMVENAYWMMGTPYHWGACSTKAVDCSGLVRVVYFNNGILTLRDARQQIDIGKRIGPSDLNSLQRGDLLFFSNTPDGRISHVAIYDNNGVYIHSSGLVKTNRMANDDPDYSNRYYRGASRIKGMTGTSGIIQMCDHPWYFNK